MPRKHGWSILTWSLRILTLFALIGFFWLRSHVAGIPATGPVIVRLKSDAEIAKLPASQDAYPCFLVERSSGDDLRSGIRQCSVTLTNATDVEQYEIDLRSGRFMLRTTDLFVRDDMPLALTRSYGAWDENSYGFGVGSSHAFDIFPYGTRKPYTYMNLLLADGEHIHYPRISQGVGYADAVYEHTGIPHTIFEKSRISWDRDHWNLKFQDGMLYRFPEAYWGKRGADGALIGVQSPAGEEIKFARDSKHNLISLTSPHGHWIKFSYDAQNRIMSAQDDAGQMSTYFYEKTGRLNRVDNGRTVWIYTYNSDGMTSVQHPEHDGVLSMSYRGGRVETLQLTGGPLYHFDYLFGRNRNVIETRVSGGRGRPAIFKFGTFSTN